MSTITEKVTRAYIRTEQAVKDGIERLNEQPESGLDDAAWKAIWITVGGAAALGLTGVLIAWATGYLNSKLGGF
jgi:hypothetical protein